MEKAWNYFFWPDSTLPPLYHDHFSRHLKHFSPHLSLLHLDCTVCKTYNMLQDRVCTAASRIKSRISSTRAIYVLGCTSVSVLGTVTETDKYCTQRCIAQCTSALCTSAHLHSVHLHSAHLQSVHLQCNKVQLR